MHQRNYICTYNVMIMAGVTKYSRHPGIVCLPLPGIVAQLDQRSRLIAAAEGHLSGRSIRVGFFIPKGALNPRYIILSRRFGYSGEGCNMLGLIEVFLTIILWYYICRHEAGTQCSMMMLLCTNVTGR